MQHRGIFTLFLNKPIQSKRGAGKVLIEWSIGVDIIFNLVFDAITSNTRLGVKVLFFSRNNRSFVVSGRMRETYF